eukprot:11687785-Karenia_brevis.AAC.1
MSDFDQAVDAQLAKHDNEEWGRDAAKFEEALGYPVKPAKERHGTGLSMPLMMKLLMASKE